MWRAQLSGIAVSTFFALIAASCTAQAQSCLRGGDAEHVAIQSGLVEHCFRVEIADSPEERQRGLMFVRHMEDDRAMLFLFDRVAEQSFWMKNTYISLDIIFIAPGGRIVNIAERTEPLSEKSIPSAAPVAAVLEINGGLAAKLGIEPGDEVRHPALRGSESEEATARERSQP